MSSHFDVKTILQLEFGNEVMLKGIVSIPETSKAIIVLSQISSKNLNNAKVTDFLNKNNYGTINMDLLSEEEFDDFAKRFDVDLLTFRLNKILEWVTANHPELADKIGIIGAGKGAAAALRVVASGNDHIKAIVCRSGRPDLVDDLLQLVKIPALFVVGSLDPEVEEYNQQACLKVQGKVKIRIIEGASHVFSEPRKLDVFEKEMLEWFDQEMAKISNKTLVSS